MSYLELLVMTERNTKGMRVCLKPNSPTVLTPTLINSLRNLQNTLAEKYISSPWEGHFYVIWYSHKNYGNQGRGLDFNYIFETLSARKEVDFEKYISKVFDLLFLNYISLGLPLINCSIIDRKITGISQEFFLLNQISFVRNNSLKNTSKKIVKSHFSDIANNLVFPKHIYQKNLFYHFSSCNLEAMKTCITGADIQLIQEYEFENIKEVFDCLENETIKQIYMIASKNIKLLQRLGNVQTVTF